MILLCLPGDLEEEVVRIAGPRVARRCADSAEVIAAAAAGLGTSALLHGDDASIDLSLVSLLHSHRLRVGIIPGRLGREQILQLGAEVVMAGQLAQFINPRQRREASDTHQRGKLIAFWGPAGSVGRTSLLRDMATFLKDAILVDADVRQPALTQLLGMPETSAIIALARHIERGGDPGEILSQVLARVGENRVLAGMNTGERWRELPAVVANKMWPALVAAAPYVLVDLSGGMDREPLREDRYAVNRSVLAQADIVLHIGRGSPVGLRRFIEHVDSLGDGSEHVGVILASAGGLGRDGVYKAQKIVADLKIPCHFIRPDPRLESCELKATSMAAYPKSGYTKDVGKILAALNL